MKEKEVAMLSVDRTFLKNRKVVSAEHEEEALLVRDFLVPPARVGVEFGITLNMGNFESVKVNVRVEAPCYTEEIEAVYKQLAAFVEEKVQAEVGSVKGILTGTTP